MLKLETMSHLWRTHSLPSPISSFAIVFNTPRMMNGERRTRTFFNSQLEIRGELFRLFCEFPFLGMLFPFHCNHFMSVECDFVQDFMRLQFIFGISIVNMSHYLVPFEAIRAISTWLKPVKHKRHVQFSRSLI